MCITNESMSKSLNGIVSLMYKKDKQFTRRYDNSILPRFSHTRFVMLFYWNYHKCTYIFNDNLMQNWKLLMFYYIYIWKNCTVLDLKILDFFSFLSDQVISNRAYNILRRSLMHHVEKLFMSLYWKPIKRLHETQIISSYTAAACWYLLCK